MARKIDATLAYQGIRKWENPNPVYARLNEGRWLADCVCPTGAELVTEGEAMVCASCGAVSEVVWPDNVAQVERALDRRNTINQNWLPGETVKMLEAENMTNGVN